MVSATVGRITGTPRTSDWSCIARYASVVGRERVIAATDCGFRWRVHPEIAWAKLESIVEGCRIATQRLWK